MIQIDSREHQKVIDGIKKAFDVAGENGSCQSFMSGIT